MSSTGWLPRQVAPKSFGVNWKGFGFGRYGHFLIKLDSPEYITETGEAVTTVLKIPYPHRIVSVEVKHTDAASDDNTTAYTTGVFKRDKWRNTGSWFDLWDFSGIVAADHLLIAGDGYEFPAGEYHFVTLNTENHLTYLEVTIQILSKKGKEYVR